MQMNATVSLKIAGTGQDEGLPSERFEGNIRLYLIQEEQTVQLSYTWIPTTLFTAQFQVMREDETLFILAAQSTLRGITGGTVRVSRGEGTGLAQVMFKVVSSGIMAASAAIKILGQLYGGVIPLRFSMEYQQFVEVVDQQTIFQIYGLGQ